MSKQVLAISPITRTAAAEKCTEPQAESVCHNYLSSGRLAPAVSRAHCLLYRADLGFQRKPPCLFSSWPVLCSNADYNHPSKAWHICCGFRVEGKEVPVRAMSRSADHFASWCPFHGIWVLVMVMWCNPWQDLLVILSHWLPEWEALMLPSKTEKEQVTGLMMNSTIHTKCILCCSGCLRCSWINSLPGQVHIFCRQWVQRLVSKIFPRRW